jgi:hypothetical protein
MNFHWRWAFGVAGPDQAPTRGAKKTPPRETPAEWKEAIQLPAQHEQLKVPASEEEKRAQHLQQTLTAPGIQQR